MYTTTTPHSRQHAVQRVQTLPTHRGIIHLLHANTHHSGENGEVLNGTTTAAPKLGPKANQGAINACLRALDRSGTPCRKWSKKPFAVRSFTGYSWGAGTYAASRKPRGEFAGDVKSDTSSTGDVSGDKPTQDSSAVMSEKSTSGADVDTPMQAALTAGASG